MSYGTVQAEKMTTESGYSLGAGNASSFKNRIINGGQVIDQRNAGASVTLNTAQTYITDRWFASEDTDGAMTCQQSSTAPTGFKYSLVATTTTADASLGATQNVYVGQKIEGFNVADLEWGTANAKTITMSFWVRSSLTGTFGGALTNAGFNRSYPYTYTINAADTWEQKTVTITGDTTGTWNYTTGTGIQLLFGLGCGTTYSGTPNAWTGSGIITATGAVSVIGTLNATWYITGVQLEVGTVATSFDFRSYGTELALCQRYYIGVSGSIAYGYPTGSTDTFRQLIYTFPVAMRTAPTVTGITWSGGTGAGYQFAQTTSVCFYVNSGDSTTGRYLSAYAASSEL